MLNCGCSVQQRCQSRRQQAKCRMWHLSTAGTVLASYTSTVPPCLPRLHTQRLASHTSPSSSNTFHRSGLFITFTRIGSRPDAPKRPNIGVPLHPPLHQIPNRPPDLDRERTRPGGQTAANTERRRWESWGSEWVRWDGWDERVWEDGRGDCEGHQCDDDEVAEACAA